MYIQPLDKTEGSIKHGQSETPVTLGTCHRTKTKNKKETHTTQHKKKKKKYSTFNPPPLPPPPLPPKWR